MFADIVMSLAWYSLLAIYIVGFTVSVFVQVLFEEYEGVFPMAVFWPIALPFIGLFLVGMVLYWGPEWLALRYREAIAKWGE